jgi:acylphosphatase
MDEKARAHIFVSGLVQGVFFRENTRRRAESLGLKGFVKNLPDGRVEAVFEGEKEKVEKMVEWAKGGSKSARVDGIDARFQEYKGEFQNFEVKYAQ